MWQVKSHNKVASSYKYTFVNLKKRHTIKRVACALVASWDFKLLARDAEAYKNNDEALVAFMRYNSQY